jgi:hypothetical protein
MKTLLFGISLASIAFGTNLALADGWPTRVTGVWNVQDNQSTGNLDITFQGTTGLCQPISGTFLGDAMHGFYCP